MRYAGVWLLTMLAVGCGEQLPSMDAGMAVIVVPDATREQCDDNQPPMTEFFGEACIADPYPVNTVCHRGAGWCINGVCRPMCAAQCPRCPGAELHFAPAGACYCTAAAS